MITFEYHNFPFRFPENLNHYMLLMSPKGSSIIDECGVFLGLEHRAPSGYLISDRVAAPIRLTKTDTEIYQI
jgi:hypothetical protein